MPHRSTLYRARKIITMNPARPSATHVAVRDGRILGVGTADELAGWGPHDSRRPLRRQGADARPRRRPQPPDGRRVLALRVLRLLRPSRPRRQGLARRDARSMRSSSGCARPMRALPDPAAALAGWGFDPIYFDNRRCVREDLDRVSTTRPLGMIHASGHIINANSAALRAVGWLRTGIEHPGVPLGSDGIPTGELKGPEPMMQVAAVLGMDRAVLAGDAAGMRLFSRLCVRAGVTTATDLASPLPDDGVRMMLELSARDDFPTRIVPLLRLMGTPAQAVRTRARIARLEHRRAAPGAHQDGRRRLDPGLLRPAALARLFQRRAQRPVVHGARTDAAGDDLGAAARRADPHPHQRRRGHRGGARRSGSRAAHHALARPPLHAAALPAGRRGAVPAHEGAGAVREPVRQPPLLLGRRTLPIDGRARARDAHERLRHRARPRRAAGDPQRCTDHAAGPAVHRLVRGAPPDRQRPRARRARAHRRARRTARDHARRGLHAEARRRDRLDRMLASAPISACSTTTRPTCRRCS